VLADLETRIMNKDQKGVLEPTAQAGSSRVAELMICENAPHCVVPICARLLPVAAMAAQLERRNAMNFRSGPLNLYVCPGRESGLMIVGSSETLRALVAQLSAALDSAGPAVDRRPREILTPLTTSPYTDTKDFKLSFHLEGILPSREVIRRVRRASPPLARIVLAVVMVMTILSLIEAIALRSL
jgi:hypothetical protein